MEAAGEQGKFWEMHDRILADLSQLSPAFLRRTAAELGLSMEQFNAALADHRFLPRIKADLEEGQRRGINATPTFIINGRQYRGAPTYAELDAAVREALRESGGRGQGSRVDPPLASEGHSVDNTGQ